MRWFSRGRACLAALSALVVPARAVVINFDNLGPNGANVTNQYAGFGVTFSNATAINYGTGYPHSGAFAVEPCFAAEFCSAPMTMYFTAGQARVKAWIGANFPISTPIQVLLHGYNASNVEVATDTVTLPVNSNTTPVRFPLEIGAVNGGIVRAEIGLPAGGYNNGISIDDVEFDTIGPPPPCLATAVPTLSLSQPVNGFTTRSNRFIYQDYAVTSDPFAVRTVTVTGPGGVKNTFSSTVSSPSYGPTWLYGMLTPGLNTVVAQIADCKGVATKTTTVNYNPLPADLGFEVQGWEVTQSIQNIQNSVPLVAGKRTFLRVYLRVTGTTTTIDNVVATLNGYPPGADPTYQHGPVLTPFNLQPLQAITVDNSDDVLSKRAYLTKSLLYELPATWTAAGRVNFVLSNPTVDGVAAPNPCDGCLYLNDISLLQYVTFYNVPNAIVHVVDFPYHKRAAATPVYAPRQKDHDYLKSWLERAYPVAGVDFSTATGPTLPFAPGEVINTSTQYVQTLTAPVVNSFLEEMRSMDESNGPVPATTRYYGMLDDGGGFMRGQADSIPSHTAAGPTGSGTFGWDGDGTYGDWYGGHELGHTYGRTHAEFCGAEACPEIVSVFCPGGYQPYPYPNGLISGGNLPLGFGFDVGDASTNHPMAVYSPSLYTDIMTYCEYEWMSDFTYERIFNRLVSEGDSSKRKRSGPISDALLITGVLNLTHDTGTLRPAWRMDKLIPSDRPVSSHYHIVFQDAAHATLADNPFDPKVDTEVQSGEDVTATLAEVVAWTAGARRVSIQRDGIEMAAVAVSPNKPTVHIISPNGGETLSGNPVNVQWQAADVDGDTLTYTLEYSRDAGSTWKTVATGITATNYAAPYSELPGSHAALFRVVATDGVNTGMDASDAVFTVGAKVPVVSIVSPANYAQFNSAQTVSFTGEATDVQDGTLNGPSLTWTSSLQGLLGTGRSVAARLKPGSHIVTFKATDSTGAMTQTFVVVTVSAAAPVPSAGPDRIVVAGQTVALDGSGSDGFAPLSWKWEIIRRPVGSSAALNDTAAAMPSFVADVVGTYTVQLTITDGGGASAVATVTITATSAVGALRIAGGLQASTTADMAAMNVETAPPSASVIDIVDALSLLRSAALPRQGSGVVTVSAANSVGGYGVVIDDPRINNWPDVPMLAGHIYVANANIAVCVLYDTVRRKWLILNESLAAMANGEKFVYTFGPSVHSLTRTAANAPFSWGVTINDAALNGNASAILLTTHDYVNTSNPSPLGVEYNGANWIAYNEGGEAMHVNERFFYADAGASGGRIIHSTSNNYGGYGVVLDDARLNGNPSALVIAQHDAQSQYNSAPMCVRYNVKSKKWAATNEDLSPLPIGEAVHYLIAQP